MHLTLLKSKVHRATVTQAELDYVGSLTMDKDLMDAAGMLPYEQVHVLNINNGARFETYLIEGERGSGVMCLNGACARLGQVNDLIIVVTFAQMTPEEARDVKPIAVHVNRQNHITAVETLRTMAGEMALTQ